MDVRLQPTFPKLFEPVKLNPDFPFGKVKNVYGEAKNLYGKMMKLIEPVKDFFMEKLARRRICTET